MSSIYDPEIITVEASDGYPLSCRTWNLSDVTAPVILCLHGIQSHSGWYEASSYRLAKAGYRVVFPDRRGSGLNTDARGDMCSYHQLIEDVMAVLTYLSCPMRVILLAISWGAKPAALLVFNSHPWLERCVYITPGWCPKVTMGLADKSSVAKGLLYHEGNRQVPIPIPGAEYFTHRADKQEYINTDPGTLHTCSARFFYETRKMDAAVRGRKSMCEVPALLLLARSDRIIDNEKTRRFFNSRFSNPLSRIIEYFGCEHTLEFDQPGLQFADDIIMWLRSDYVP